MADNAGVGDVDAVELTRVGAGEEDETRGEMTGCSEMGDSEVSIATALRRSTETVSSRPLSRILKVLSPRENTWHGPP